MANHKVKIRRAKKRDIPEILKLIRQWCREDKEKLPRRISPAVIKSSFGKARTSTLLVAEDKSGVIAYAYITPTHEITSKRPDLFLQDLYVTKKIRSLGVGDQMMAAIARLAKKEGSKAVYWMVAKKNKRGKKFYKKLGANVGNYETRNLKGKALMAKAKQGKAI